MYNKVLMDHFQRPRNQGAIKNADGIGQTGNPVCGDVMKIYLKIKPKKKSERTTDDIISNIKFETLGCGAAIANSSVLTTMAKGKTLKQALKIKKSDVADALGGVPKVKLHCSVLATDALKKAVEDYLNKDGGK